jgi:N-acylneuraminate cytidylyltransferase
MIAWTIEAAINSGLFDKVIVSTDDMNIAEVAEKYGATVPFLRDHHNDDYSTVSDVTIYVLKELKKRLNLQYDIVVQLMANCPLRNAVDIRNSIYNFVEKKSSFQISCFKFGWMNPWWAHSIDEQQIVTPLFPKALKSRSQDLPNLYCPTGAIWIALVNKLIKTGSFYENLYNLFQLPLQSSIDIDDYDDLEMAKFFFNNKDRCVNK